MPWRLALTLVLGNQSGKAGAWLLVPALSSLSDSAERSASPFLIFKVGEMDTTSLSGNFKGRRPQALCPEADCPGQRGWRAVGAWLEEPELGMQVGGRALLQGAVFHSLMGEGRAAARSCLGGRTRASGCPSCQP